MSGEHPTALILASTSPYRQKLLRRLQLDFAVEAPGVPEEPRPDEHPRALARRLAAEKALAVSHRNPQSLVLGSDQVAALDGELLEKPGTAARAREQLRRSSGRTVNFYTALAVARCGAIRGDRCVETQVVFRRLNAAAIADYVQREQPLDCAGSFRWEALGIVLFRELRSADPTALEGLPLIETVGLLEEEGINVLNTAS